MLLNPGKWIGAGLGAIPGGLAGGAIGNGLGRPLGLFLLPGKWLFGHIGGVIGDLLDRLAAPIENVDTLIPAMTGCDCGCDRSTDPCTCTSSTSTSASAEDPVRHDIERFRQETMLALRNPDIPQTGDKGVEACMATSIFSALILLFLAGARKRED